MQHFRGIHYWISERISKAIWEPSFRKFSEYSGRIFQVMSYGFQRNPRRNVWKSSWRIFWWNRWRYFQRHINFLWSDFSRNMFKIPAQEFLNKCAKYPRWNLKKNYHQIPERNSREISEKFMEIFLKFMAKFLKRNSYKFLQKNISGIYVGIQPTN